MRGALGLAGVAVIVAGPGLAAACTQDQALGKSTTFGQLMQAKVQQDPRRAGELMRSLRPAMERLDALSAADHPPTGADLDTMCAAYDEMIEKLK